MADAVTGATGKVVWQQYGPRPGIQILRSWQGIVEIALRAACIVLAFAAFVSACSSAADLDNVITSDNLASLSRSDAGWVIFTTLLVSIMEGVVITMRFLNFPIVNNYSTIFHIIDACISGIFALNFFVSAIPAAVYSGRWAVFRGQTRFSQIDRLGPDFGALATFGFFLAIALVALSVWMVLSVVFKWNDSAKYSSPESHGVEDS